MCVVFLFSSARYSGRTIFLLEGSSPFHSLIAFGCIALLLHLWCYLVETKTKIKNIYTTCMITVWWSCTLYFLSCVLCWIITKVPLALGSGAPAGSRDTKNLCYILIFKKTPKDTKNLCYILTTSLNKFKMGGQNISEYTLSTWQICIILVVRIWTRD